MRPYIVASLLMLGLFTGAGGTLAGASVCLACFLGAWALGKGCTQ